MDRRLEPAKEWEPQIDENLRKSKTFIVLISSDSVESNWVKHEGSMAFALNQFIIPIQIEQFGTTYSAAKLPIWAAKIQLLKLIDGSNDYEDTFQELKQLLGEPLPIRQYLEEMFRQYEHSGMLLDEVALALVEKNYHKLFLPKDKKALLDKIIRESKVRLESYLAGYEILKNDYKKAQEEIDRLKTDRKLQIITYGLLLAIILPFLLYIILLFR
jgi:hypothetical protein